RVCVLASGDPGFFGIVRLLGMRVGTDNLVVHPAPSSVSLAFARLGWSWDDALVVSAHGRPLAEAIASVLRAPKAAVLTSPDNPPEAIGAALLACGSSPRSTAVLTRIGEVDEAVFEGDLDALAAGSFDPMSVVVLRDPVVTTSGPSVTWGRDESDFEHRNGMITKAEVRSVVLAKLALPRAGVLWDLGAGSGSVGIEAARLCPGLRVFAVERDAESVARIQTNAATHGVSIDVVHGDVAEVLGTLPDPDRVFVGGGGLDGLDASLTRLRAGGGVVATFALVDRAVLAWRRLGNLIQLSVARGTAAGDGVRLQPQNPVFVCWGPEPSARES
ncbi:MAG TPA: precorrin-6y C5,15-methyltransferase (decarboxylating) subunit CbiE, partial [Acidimicrobiia bacterium]|nr:precorrin-6y C5,15-methyltransferase (decarboxylating) subunit CbiE [Acidimicrobiia bacterium]